MQPYLLLSQLPLWISKIMSHVEFPGLGWSFDINSTAFSIGSFEIKWYGLLIATGFY